MGKEGSEGGEEEPTVCLSQKCSTFCYCRVLIRSLILRPSLSPSLPSPLLNSMCFEGERFRPCDLRDPKLRWAIGVRFTSSGQGERYFYKAFQPELCLSRTKKGPTLGDCSGWGAKRWSIKGGQLAQGDGDMCVVRNFDNSAGMEKCKEAFEFVSAVPHDPAVTATGGQGGVSKLTQSVPVTAGIGIGY